MEAANKIERFFRVSAKYMGKEIGLESGQIFDIERIVDPGKYPEYEDHYSIQYGFPQSGSVCMGFGYSHQTNEVSIDEISVYAPPAGEDFVIANYTPETQVGPLGIRVNFGLDMGTVEHSTMSSIEGNPNALKMLDTAISDLEKAQILGECRIAVPEGETHLPCTHSTPIQRTQVTGEVEKK